MCIATQKHYGQRCHLQRLVVSPSHFSMHGEEKKKVFQSLSQSSKAQPQNFQFYPIPRKSQGPFGNGSNHKASFWRSKDAFKCENKLLPWESLHFLVLGRSRASKINLAFVSYSNGKSDSRLCSKRKEALLFWATRIQLLSPSPQQDNKRGTNVPLNARKCDVGGLGQGAPGEL